MFSGDFIGGLDASVATALASLLIAVSGVVLLLDRARLGGASTAHRISALTWVHIWFIFASTGLLIGFFAPYWISGSMIISGTLFGLVSGYVALSRALGERVAVKRWAILCAIGATAQCLIAYRVGQPGPVIVTTSIVNLAVIATCAPRLYALARREQFHSVWMLVFPFVAIGIGYAFRLGLIAFGAPVPVLSVAVAGIAVLYPLAAMFWVFGAISLHGFRLARELDRAVFLDPLTGLGNRADLERFLNDAERAQSATREKDWVCIAIDLDHFKEVNDTYGHEAGDLVLAETAERLRVHGKPGDRIFRVGGDEACFWRELGPADDPMELAGSILTDLCAPVRFNGVDVVVGASVGIDIGPAGSLRSLLRQADIALYHSKASGRYRMTRYDAGLGAAYHARLEISRDLRAALSKGEIVAYYQPQFDVESFRLIGCEVLARWRHPERGLIEAWEFLPVAVELGLIGELDRRVLDQTVEACARWRAEGIHPPRISLNVSAARLRDAELIEELEARPDLPLGCMSFEVREALFVDNDEMVRWNVDRLRGLGISIEIDDFGTGNVPLNAVLEIHPERIKIDQAFVAGIEDDERKRLVLASLVEFVQRSGAAAIVEGVESLAAFGILAELGASGAQGFALAAPMDFEAMSDWLADRGRAENTTPRSA